MVVEYPTVRVGDFADTISKTHKMEKEYLIFLNTSDILQGKLLHHTYTSVKDWPGQAKKSICKDDILFSEIRPANGRWAFVDEKADDFVVSTKLMVIRARKDRLLPRYLYQFLTSHNVTRWLQHLAESRSGTFPQITFDQVASLEIPLPPLGEQKTIAHIIGSLDDKIELNRRMNATLEAMLRVLFQSWFVDFDPVRAKLDGAKPAGLDADTAAFFPTHFQDSPLGHIPQGWTGGKVGDLATLGRAAINPGNFPDETFDHFSLPAFDNGQAPKIELGSAIMSNKLVVAPNSVLLSKLNPHIPRIWLPDLRSSHRSVCSTEFMVACAKPGFSREYLFALFTNPTFASVYGTLVTGTTGSHQRIKPESVLEMSVVIPTLPLIQAFTNATKPMFDRINRNIEQSRTLATLRDALLPKLLSGEITANGQIL